MQGRRPGGVWAAGSSKKWTWKAAAAPPADCVWIAAGRTQSLYRRKVPGKRAAMFGKGVGMTGVVDFGRMNRIVADDPARAGRVD